MKKQVSFFQRLMAIVIMFIMVLTVTPIQAGATDTNGMVATMGSDISIPNDNTHVLGRAEVKQTVHGYPSAGNNIGSISERESFTILNPSVSDYMYVEYSSPSGTKKGYILRTGNIIYSDTVLATVTQTATVYYGNESRFQAAGTVYTGENVVVVESNSSWCFIEYNTTSGRKRAYIPKQYLNLKANHYKDLKINPYNTPYISGRYTVYAGPTDQYCVVGYVENEYVDVKQEISAYDKTVLRINYHAGSSWKSGYILM